MKDVFELNTLIADRLNQVSGPVDCQTYYV